jgi:hypothetical protein
VVNLEAAGSSPVGGVLGLESLTMSCDLDQIGVGIAGRAYWALVRARGSRDALMAGSGCVALDEAELRRKRFVQAIQGLSIEEQAGMRVAGHRRDIPGDRIFIADFGPDCRYRPNDQIRFFHRWRSEFDGNWRTPSVPYRIPDGSGDAWERFLLELGEYILQFGGILRRDLHWVNANLPPETSGLDGSHQVSAVNSALTQAEADSLFPSQRFSWAVYSHVWLYKQKRGVGYAIGLTRGGRVRHGEIRNARSAVVGDRDPVWVYSSASLVEYRLDVRPDLANDNPVVQRADELLDPVGKVAEGQSLKE